jgi:sugar phosphate isomerase/epimerase
MGNGMGRFLIVSRGERLKEYRKLAGEYDVGFEINDFFDPEILDDKVQQKNRIKKYLDGGIPKGSTMHGAFLDVVVFSRDREIRRVSRQRMRQSMELAVQLGVKGVVFHTNTNPMLSGEEYDGRAVSMTVNFLKELLTAYPDLDIYLENMFDRTPDFLRKVSEQLENFDTFGVCFDYAHTAIYGSDMEQWVTQLAPFVKHIHINDNDGKQDLHLAVGKGHIDWEQFRTYYDRYFRACSVLIETNEPEAQRESLEYLAEMRGRYGK